MERMSPSTHPPLRVHRPEKQIAPGHEPRSSSSVTEGRT